MPEYMVICTPDADWEHFAPTPVDPECTEGAVICVDHAVECCAGWTDWMDYPKEETICESCLKTFKIQFIHNQWVIGYREGEDHICWSWI
jgi:hypothetical protein